MCFDAHNTDVFAFKQTTRLLSALDAAFQGLSVTLFGAVTTLFLSCCGTFFHTNAVCLFPRNA